MFAIICNDLRKLIRSFYVFDLRWVKKNYVSHVTAGIVPFGVVLGWVIFRSPAVAGSTKFRERDFNASNS